MIDITLIGCGAIAEAFYLPALAKKGKLIRDVILVDRDEAQLAKLSARYPVRGTTQDYSELIGEVDGAIIATPPHLHFEMAMAFLKLGIPVLVEKPLAESSTHAAHMISIARSSGAEILVNNTRRLFPSSQRVKEIIDLGTIGRIGSLEYYEGGEFNWPTISGFYFNTNHAKGVLSDRGSHILDLVCWWLGKKPTLMSYRDDSFGSPEAVASVDLRANGCSVNVNISLLTKLKNQYIIRGELGTIEGSVYDWRKFSLVEKSGRSKVIKVKNKIRHYSDFGHIILDNFLDIISGRNKPVVTAADVVDSIQLIEECYQNRRQFDMPWMKTFTMAPNAK